MFLSRNSDSDITPTFFENYNYESEWGKSTLIGVDISFVKVLIRFDFSKFTSIYML